MSLSDDHRAAVPTGRPHPFRLAVVGAGIAGLAAANHAAAIARDRGRDVTVTLFEASARLGGHILTERTPEGFLIEVGPDCFVSQKPAGVRAARDGALIVQSTKPLSTTFVLSGGSLHPLPEGTMLMVPTRFLPLARSGLLTWPGKLRMGLDLVLPRGGSGDETLGDFVRRRLGTEALEKIAEPLVAGVHAGDPDRLSLISTFPRFKAMEVDHRSIVLAMVRARRERTRVAKTRPGASDATSAFVTIEGGLDRLTGALAASLPATAVRLSSPVEAIERARSDAVTAGGAVRGSPSFVLRLRGDKTGRGEPADAVILATSAGEAGGMLAAIDPALSAELQAIETVSAVTVNLGFRRADVAHPLDGFGLVIPRKEERPIMGVTWSSSKFSGRAPEGYVLLRVFVGGVKGPRALSLDDEALLQMVRSELGGLLGVCAPPTVARIFRWPGAMPQYNVGHAVRLDRIDRALAAMPGLALAGGSYRGIGIPDCIQSGREAVERLLADSSD